MPKTFDSQTAKFISIIASCLPKELSADLMQRWIENPKRLQEVLLIALTSLHKYPQDIPVWKTIQLGQYKTSREYQCALLKSGCKIYCSNQDIDNVDCSKNKEEVDLVMVTVRDLFLGEEADYSEIVYRAKACLLELCPSEVALALRLSYINQPRKERLAIAMEPFVSDGQQWIFMLEREGRLTLEGRTASPTDEFFADEPLVFVRPRK